MEMNLRRDIVFIREKTGPEDSDWFSVIKRIFKNNSHFPNFIYFEIKRCFTAILTELAVPVLWKMPRQTEIACRALDTSSLFLRCS